MVRLQHGAHGAIEDQDPRGQRIIELLSPETIDQGNVYFSERRCDREVAELPRRVTRAAASADLLRRCVPNETVSGFPVR